MTEIMNELNARKTPKEDGIMSILFAEILRIPRDVIAITVVISCSHISTQRKIQLEFMQNLKLMNCLRWFSFKSIIQC